jgi:hypothetical protein
VFVQQLAVGMQAPLQSLNVLLHWHWLATHAALTRHSPSVQQAVAGMQAPVQSLKLALHWH